MVLTSSQVLFDFKNKIIITVIFLHKINDCINFNNLNFTFFLNKVII